MRTESRLLHLFASRSQDVELVGERQLRAAGILCLSFAYHVNHSDAARVTRVDTTDLNPSIDRIRLLMGR